MGWIFGDGTSGMLYAGGALLLVMYLYLWFARPLMAIEVTQSIGKALVAIVTVLFKILFALFKWLIDLFGAMFSRRRR